MIREEGERAGSQKLPYAQLHLMGGRTKFCPVRLRSLKFSTVAAPFGWTWSVGRDRWGRSCSGRSEKGHEGLGIPHTQHFLKNPIIA